MSELQVKKVLLLTDRLKGKCNSAINSRVRLIDDFSVGRSFIKWPKIWQEGFTSMLLSGHLFIGDLHVLLPYGGKKIRNAVAFKHLCQRMMIGCGKHSKISDRPL